MLALFLGEGGRPFHDGVPAHLTTDWQLRLVDPSATTEATRSSFAEAEAIIAAHYGPDLPPAPRLRLLQVPGAGYDGVDQTALRPEATLCNVFEHEPGVAEFAILAMLEWCHRLGSADAAVRRGDWSRCSRYGGPPDDELYGKTLAIVGLGRIGQAVAVRAHAFGMRVVAVNRTPRPPSPGVDQVLGLERLHDVLGEAHFIVLACALTPETTGLIGATALAAMRPDAVIVNVARGPVIDEAALAAALQERRIGGAAIDTWWRYPAQAQATDEAEPFAGLANTLLSPHVAGWTGGTIRRRTRFIAANLDRLARGEPLENVVRPGA